MIDLDKAYDTLISGEVVHFRHKFVSDEYLKDYYNLFFLSILYLN